MIMLLYFAQDNGVLIFRHFYKNEFYLYMTVPFLNSPVKNKEHGLLKQPKKLPG